MTRQVQALCVVLVGLPLLALSPEPLPVRPRLFDEGHAAYYSASYTQARWRRIYNKHKLAGRITENPFSLQRNGYHCVHAKIDKVGVRLILRANGVTIRCVTADTVKVEHKEGWGERWAIELSWTAFKKLKLDENNSVQVFLAH